MGLIEIVLIIAIAGLVVWLITTFVPMPPQFKTAIYVIAGLFLLVWLLRSLGLIGDFGGKLRVGQSPQAPVVQRL